eukprot:803889_1
MSIGNPILQGHARQYHGPFQNDHPNSRTSLRRNFNCSSDSAIYASWSYAYCDTEGDDHIVAFLDNTDTMSTPNVDMNGGHALEGIEKGTSFEDGLSASIPSISTTECDETISWDYKNVTESFLGNRSKGMNFEVTFELQQTNGSAEFLVIFNIHLECRALPTSEPIISDSYASCMPAEELKPLYVICIGIYVQWWIASIISSRKKNTAADEHESEESATKVKTPSLKANCIHVTVLLLKVWQIISIIVICALDILYFVDYMQAMPHKSEWSHYLCFVQILTNSSNLKRCLVNVVVYTGSIKFKDGWRAVIKDEYHEEGALHAIFVFVMVIWLQLLGWSLGFVVFLPGFVCYIWIVFALFLVICTIIGFALAVTGGKDDLKKYQIVALYALGISPKWANFKNINDSEETPEMKQIFVKMPIMMIGVIFVVLLCTLSQSYWYSGHYDYIQSFVAVMTERTTDA